MNAYYEAIVTVLLPVIFQLTELSLCMPETIVWYTDSQNTDFREISKFSVIIWHVINQSEHMYGASEVSQDVLLL